ncbi:MAG: TetR/AcrR family transcriptional regulator [Winogradskyella sp.]|nr:TetR/AcrR family transcriptional regulator [Bacteroidia bacterium]NNF86525.1 TetR/AcrR family transcriptional regulator [Winogradskyella sp.]NNK39291.1 TetR/AcrR family transcriptional regulator [Winogradskyella sp.]
MKTENRKTEIVRVAAHLFKEKGYSAVTMRDLAKTMGIKAASLYNHIESKQSILQDIIVSIAEEFTQGMSSILAESSNSIDKLNKIISLHVTIASKNADGMAALNTDWMHLEDKLNYYLDLRNSYEENFRKIIQAGIDNNEIKNENVEVILFSLLSTLRSLYLWIPKKENLNEAQLASSLSHILIKGINT